MVTLYLIWGPGSHEANLFGCTILMALNTFGVYLLLV